MGSNSGYLSLNLFCFTKIVLTYLRKYAWFCYMYFQINFDVLEGIILVCTRFKNKLLLICSSCWFWFTIVLFADEYQRFSSIQTFVDYSYIEISTNATLLPKKNEDWEQLEFVSKVHVFSLIRPQNSNSCLSLTWAVKIIFGLVQI